MLGKETKQRKGAALFMEARPGWYEDPAGTGGERYFDGDEWTKHLRGGGELAEQPPGETTGS